jgi:hypothetical protein
MHAAQGDRRHGQAVAVATVADSALVVQGIDPSPVRTEKVSSSQRAA